MEPTRLFPIIIIFSILTVEFGGAALLNFLTSGDELSDFEEQFFRAGHGHAGVLLILSLVYFLYADRAKMSEGLQWVAGAVLAVGVLAQSGGFFLHYALGEPGERSIGTLVTISGGILLAVALVILGVSLIRA